MLNKILIVLIILFTLTSITFSQTKDQLISDLRSEYQKLDKLHNDRSRSLVKAANTNIRDIKNQIMVIKKKLSTLSGEFDKPIYFSNDISLDQNIDLVDFYVYEYSDNSYQVFARLKNKQRKYLEWVKLRYTLYLNGTFVTTDYTYIDYETYGYTGISPYKLSFINTFIDKVDFDSIAYSIEYDIETGNDDIMWDQLLVLETVNIRPSGNYFKWNGLVKNDYNYSVRFPNIYACIFKENRMVCLDYTYLDVQNDSLPPYSTGVFDSYIDLPDSYDNIKYYLNYSLYSLEGNGNLPPNTPIFSEEHYYGNSRINTDFEAFVIDPNKDRIDLSFDFGDGNTSELAGNYISGYNAEIHYLYAQAGEFNVKAKASDGSLESNWSDSVVANITLSSSPLIITTEIDTAFYKNSFAFQFSQEGGITPITWQIQNGVLPNGLNFNSNTGVLSGVPLVSGSFQFDVYCNDSGTPTASDSVAYQLRVYNQKPIIISQDTINADVNTPFSYTAQATDPDENPITFEYLDYPNWLSVTNSTLSGETPNQILDTSFTLMATDGDLSDTTQVFISIRSKKLMITTGNIDSAIYKHEHIDTLCANGGLKPYLWSVIYGELPSGLILDDSGILSGLPDLSGLYYFSVQVQDSDDPPQLDNLFISLNVINNSPYITSNDTSSIRKGKQFIYNASAVDPDGNQIHYQFYNYPSWLSVADTIISGIVPFSASDTSFSFLVTDGDLSDSLNVTIIIKEPTSVNSEKYVPESFQMSDAYPNPFNPSTTIKLEIPKNMHIKILIFDINGKLVNSLFQGQLDIGTYKYTWNTSNISSGIYFIKLESRDFNKVVKCMLLK